MIRLHRPGMVPGLASADRRGRRVALLLLGVTLLGLGDLVATAVHMHGLGFIEANPFAKHLVAAQSTEGLVLFKLGSIGIAVGLIAMVREQPAGEVGGWVLVLIMVGLTLQWHHYSVMLETELTRFGDLEEFSRQLRLAASAS